MKRVPGTSGSGVSRRAYQASYNKSATNKTADVLGSAKKLRDVKIDEPTKSTRDHGKISSKFDLGDWNISFGETGRETVPKLKD